jgi:hypothetical protein
MKTIEVDFFDVEVMDDGMVRYEYKDNETVFCMIHPLHKLEEQRDNLDNQIESGEFVTQFANGEVFDEKHARHYADFIHQVVCIAHEKEEMYQQLGF